MAKGIIATDAEPVLLVPYADRLQGQISAASTMANTPDNAASSTTEFTDIVKIR